MDLYDTIVWFDDFMHFMNTGLIAAAVIPLTVPRSSPLIRSVERALAYADTLGDLALGTAGAVIGGIAVRRGEMVEAPGDTRLREASDPGRLVP